jgi:hypothetical protein
LELYFIKNFKKFSLNPKGLSPFFSKNTPNLPFLALFAYVVKSSSLSTAHARPAQTSPKNFKYPYVRFGALEEVFMSYRPHGAWRSMEVLEELA